MVLVLKKDITGVQKEAVCKYLLDNHLKINEITGEDDTIIAAAGRFSVDQNEAAALPGVRTVIPISKPYKLASREFKKENTVVEVPNGCGQIIRIGGNRIAVIAGPRAVESRSQIMETAAYIAECGAVMLRGDAYSPNSSPYKFCGIGEKGLEYLKEAGEKYGLPVVTQISSPSVIPVLKDVVDVFQVAARNMQDFNLLREVSALGKPVILRRSHSATLEELLMSAEYLLSGGTDNVILCERGIRTFEHATCSTLDLSAVPVLRSLTHLPIIVDPCHSVAVRDKVGAMGLASVAVGADGLMLEVHVNPEKALIDGARSLLLPQFGKMMHDIEALAPVIGKSVQHIRPVLHSLNVSDCSGVLSSGCGDGFAESQENIIVQSSSCSTQSFNSVQKSFGEQESVNIRKTVISYSGKRGAYAEQAIFQYFDNDDVEAVAVDSFDQVFQNVMDGVADFGMVPIENSLAGSVYQNYDNFLRFEDVSIAGAVVLNIRHALLGVKGSSLDDIQTVYSHPQALNQSRKFLSRYRNWTLVDSVSTSSAAQLVSQSASVHKAAIASPRNATLYNLEILAEDIEDDPGNFTRFVIIRSNRLSGQTFAFCQNIKQNMASFIFKTKNRPGALNEVLTVFASHSLNLTRLESRPVSGEPWRYWFYADVEVSDGMTVGKSCRNFVEKLLSALKDRTEEVRLLGIYAEENTSLPDFFRKSV